ncbi:MAG: STAS domain-containing protein [Bacillota bacterium]
MEINKKSSQRAEVVADEKIDITNSQELKKELLELIDSGYRFITLDFSAVESVDSSGLGKLLLIHKRLKEQEGELKITNVTSDYVQEMFSMIHLDKVLQIDNLE